MALSLPTFIIPYSKLQANHLNTQNQNSLTLARCKTTDSADGDHSKLKVGSAIVVVEAPEMIKTAASVPCLRVNAGLVKQGDVGRIVARKPKDVWAVRLAIGTYLMDGKNFKPLDLDE